jgi:uncharacterized membrane protein HdeD (DUF308 family)
MKSSTAMLVTMIGLLITFGGVGGIENSVTNEAMLGSMLVAIVGLLVMYCGTIALRVADYYDQRG